MKKKIIIVSILILSVIAFWIFTLPEPFNQFCNKAYEYPDIENFTAEENIAYNLGRLVRDTLYHRNMTEPFNLNLTGIEILEVKSGDCNAHALLYKECCWELGLECAIKSYTNDEVYHAWNAVLINNRWRTVDSHVSESDSYHIFITSHVSVSDWVLIVFKEGLIVFTNKTMGF